MTPRVAGSPSLWSGVTIVTGTDTDVGKSVVTAVLAAALHRRGVGLAVVKPAQTGLAPESLDGDVQVVERLAGLPAGVCHEYVRLPEPLAPSTAGRRAGIALPAVTEHARRIADLARAHDSVLVEGAGGVLVGLDDAGRGLLELADALRCRGVPTGFVVVARAGLGTLNHSALTCRAIRGRGHDLSGLVIGAVTDAESLAGPDHLAERCNLEEISEFCDAPILFTVPSGVGASPERVQEAAGGVPLTYIDLPARSDVRQALA
ncbi:dethiobiotin synthase [Austwickia chelonae]|uniref:dethiobiotin synthase n=1 Tax=Austwickia chelonae TaxID=100225 RepID=UPI000E25FE5A|nr:dethiobiotin synthase [Austwickia chelonae]